MEAAGATIPISVLKPLSRAARLLSVAAALCGCPGTSPDPQGGQKVKERQEAAARDWAEGQRLTQAKEYAAAVEPLTRSFEAEPGLEARDKIKAGLALTEVLLAEARYPEALQGLERLEGHLGDLRAPADAEILKARAKEAFLKGRALRELGRFEEAERALKSSLELQPKNAATLALLGNVLARLGKHGDAVPRLEESLRGMEAVGLASGREQVHYQLAKSLQALGRSAEAEKNFRLFEELQEKKRQRDRLERDQAYKENLARLDSNAGHLGRADTTTNAAEALSSPESAPARSGPWFVNCARESGIDFVHDRGARGGLHLFETMGGGAAWLDYDQDGDPDLYLVSGQPVNSGGTFPGQGKNKLYRNDAGKFVDVTAAARVAGHGFGLGATAGDIDNDGYPDLFVICFGPNVLYRNRGDGTFEEVSSSGTEGIDPFHASACCGDFDGDGLLDLFVTSYVRYDVLHPQRCSEKKSGAGEPIPIYCGPISFEGAPNRLYKNLGAGVFKDVSFEAGIGAGKDRASKSLGALAADLDEDGDLDIFVACDTTANLLYRNRGGAFDEVGLEAGVAASDSGLLEGSMGIALADADGDLRADLFVTNFQEESNRLYLGSKKGEFFDGTAQTGIGLGSRPLVGWGTGFFDAGCDGSLDLFVANGHIYHNAAEWIPGRTYKERNLLYASKGREYRERGIEAGEVFQASEAFRGAAFADYDLDGDVDILVTALDSPPYLLRAEGPRGHYLEVDLIGSGPGGRDAVGARVDIVTRSGRQVRWRFGGGSYLSASEGRLHFGLGQDDRVERLTVTWPGGKVTALEGLPADQRVTVRK
jgi:tetratricopeptide (TPR) repeat protein